MDASAFGVWRSGNRQSATSHCLTALRMGGSSSHPRGCLTHGRPSHESRSPDIHASDRPTAAFLDRLGASE
jgi:hypothetical protein